MIQPSGIVTLLTDFGTRDPYVGVMKGVILSVSPQARIVDLTHDVPPQDVAEAAWLLRGAFRFFPAGTVHVVVVDPGVGGDRRAVAAGAHGHLFVAPDNGVLSWAIGDSDAADVVALTNSRYFLPEISPTFHGRDVFAPVAAHLSAGVPLDALGPRVRDPATLPLPRPRVKDAEIRTEVIHVDRFGNLITALDETTFREWEARRPGAVIIDAAGQIIEGVSATYSAAPPGSLLALFQSSGHLEIAARDGNAAAVLAVGRGEPIVVRRR